MRMRRIFVLLSYIVALLTGACSAKFNDLRQQRSIFIDTYENELKKYHITVKIKTKKTINKSLYALEQVPATLTINALFYKKGKLCHKDKIEQMFYISKTSPTMHSQQWQGQYDAMMSKFIPKFTNAIGKCR